MSGAAQHRPPGSDAASLLTAGNLAVWTGGRWRGGRPASVAGASIDTRRLRPGELFFAVAGDRRDGHDFVDAAFAAGAAGAVVAAGYGGAAPGGPLLEVDDPRRALRAAAEGYRAALDPIVVGVTGSAGKSTVKELTAAVLSRRFRTARTPGNWNNELGVPLSLLAMAPGTEAVVLELATNHPGEIALLSALARPSIGMVTTVGAVHIAFFESVAAIAREKAALLRALPGNGLAILNLDSDCLDVLRAHVPCALRTVRGPALRPSPGLDAGRPEEQIDPHRGGDYVCTAWEPRSRRVAVWDGPAGRREELAIPLPGRHHAVNVLLAAAVARHLGLDWDDIRAGLACFEGMPMRWAERRVGNVRMINDAYNANPLNMRASIGCFAEEDDAPGKWLVLGGMLELGAREAVEHDALGRFIAGWEWAGLITVGDLGGRIADGAVAAGMAAERIVRCSDAASAAAELRERASGGDAVLIKGSRRFRLEDVMTGFEQRGGERE